MTSTRAFFRFMHPLSVRMVVDVQDPFRGGLIP